MCNQHVTNHSSDHTVRVILKEATKHNIHWPLDEDITNAELERILLYRSINDGEPEEL